MIEDKSGLAGPVRCIEWAAYCSLLVRNHVNLPTPSNHTTNNLMVKRKAAPSRCVTWAWWADRKTSALTKTLATNMPGQNHLLSCSLNIETPETEAHSRLLVSGVQPCELRACLAAIFRFACLLPST